MLLKIDRVRSLGTYVHERVGERGLRLEMCVAQRVSGQQLFQLRRDIFQVNEAFLKEGQPVAGAEREGGAASLSGETLTLVQGLKQLD